MTSANLHTHSIFSDGLCSPAALVQAADQAGLEYLGLTDHDTLSGIEPMFRAQSSLPAGSNLNCLAGIELTCRQAALKIDVHLLGYFPHMNLTNYMVEMTKLDQTLINHCSRLGWERSRRDVDGRIRKAFQVNLDGVACGGRSAEEVIKLVRASGEAALKTRLADSDQSENITGPPQLTYQALIEAWPELVPGSSKERMTLYCLKPTAARRKRLARLLEQDGFTPAQAVERAERDQGVLVDVGGPEPDYPSIGDGLNLLRENRAVTVLAHPAVDWNRIDSRVYDDQVLNPLISTGLDGVEVFYPYDPAYRDRAIDHYLSRAAEFGLLITGGTDFHGDGRSGLTDGKLPLREVRKLMDRGRVGAMSNRLTD